MAKRGGAVEEIKEEDLPPIVKMSEAKFIKEKVDKPWAEIFEALKEEDAKEKDGTKVKLIDRVTLKKLFDATLLRSPEQKEYSKAKFDEAFDGIPKYEEAKEPRLSDDAYEYFIRHAIHEGYIPSRLETELERIHQKEEEPSAEKVEETMLDFFQNEALSDVQLIHPATKASHKCHRVVVAAGSKYLLDIFKQNSVEDLPSVTLPEAYNQHYEVTSEDQISRILKYLYSNQDIYKIKDEINEQNIFHLYATAYALKCTKLLTELNDIIMSGLLNEENVTHFYLDSIEFENKELETACQEVLFAKFDDILTTSTDFLVSIPAKQILDLLSNDQLAIQHEAVLVDLVKAYIEKRDKIVEAPVRVAPEATDIWGQLNAEEQAKRKEEWDKEQAELDEVARAASKEEADSFQALEGAEKIQFLLNKQNEAGNEKIKARLEIVKLTDDEVADLFKIIRYSYLPQDKLLELSSDDVFAPAREYIIQALSVRITPDNFDKSKISINIEPRVKYIPEQLGGPGLNFPPPLRSDSTVGSIGGANINALTPLSAQGHLTEEQKQTFNQYVATNPYLKRSVMGNNMYQQKLEDERMRVSAWGNTGGRNPAFGQQQNVYAQTQYQQNRNEANNAWLNNQGAQRTLAAQRESAQSAVRKAQTFGYQPGSGFDSSLYPRAPQGGAMQGLAQVPGQASLSQTGSRVPQSMYSGVQPPVPGQQIANPTEFVYEFDFDENGALYWLGSHGKRKLWENPHKIAQVISFASSIGAGSVEDFVGRTVVNCRTHNEPQSFYGVDLGHGRALLPTRYSIRNRSYSNCVMFDWHFEGSNDKVNWALLDRRIYSSTTAEEQEEKEAVQQHLSQKGATSTWHIDTDCYKDLGFDGFRYFRIIQVSKNSSDSDNLSLSGFELYGRVVSGKWT